MNGQQLADIGIEQARSHAERKISDWTEQIMDCLEKWAAIQTRPFAIEDFRNWIIHNRIDLIPPSHQAWGSVGRMANHRGIVRMHGYRTAKSGATRGHPVRTYVRAV